MIWILMVVMIKNLKKNLITTSKTNLKENLITITATEAAEVVSNTEEATEAAEVVSNTEEETEVMIEDSKRETMTMANQIC